MKRALNVNEVLKIKDVLLPMEGKWAEMIGSPSKKGSWLIWGNSGNGKSSFAMQLCKELCKYGRVAYNSFEEKYGKTIQNNLVRHGMSSVSKRMIILNSEPLDELAKRMKRPHNPDFYVFDSFQYINIDYRAYIKFKESHSNKLLIFISHADGNKPLGRAAKSVMYDADLKIWIEGYRAFSKGRYIGSTGQFDIWPEGAAKYWGESSIPKIEK